MKQSCAVLLRCLSLTPALGSDWEIGSNFNEQCLFGCRLPPLCLNSQPLRTAGKTKPDMLLDLLIALAALATILTHAWSIKAHFRSERLPDGARLISGLVILSGVVLSAFTVLLEQPAAAQLAGLALMMAAYGLFWRAIAETRAAALLAAFDEKVPGSLVTTGPYRFVRHPFYVSYMLFWAGWGIACWTLWAIIPLVGMTATYWRAALDEEAKFARTPMAAQYQSYMKTTARFIPGVL
jgi:protein-S-isoprenylcysteine O-methyltransferase Ste14